MKASYDSAAASKFTPLRLGEQLDYNGVALNSCAGEWWNGRHPGPRTLCRVSGVSVRIRPRLPS